MAKKGADVTNQSSGKIEDKVLENLVQLQKVQVILAEKLDRLSDQISKLLGLFELAAKSLAQSPGIKPGEKDNDLLEKLNSLLDQNKTIAKGLTLMEERMRERVYGTPKQTEEFPQIKENAPEQAKSETGEYIPSPSSTRPLPRF